MSHKSEENMGVPVNGDTPKSSILIGFSIINHPFWGTLIFGNTHMVNSTTCTVIYVTVYYGILGWYIMVLSCFQGLVHFGTLLKKLWKSAPRVWARSSASWIWAFAIFFLRACAWTPGCRFPIPPSRFDFEDPKHVTFHGNLSSICGCR